MPVRGRHRALLKKLTVKEVCMGFSATNGLQRFAHPSKAKPGFAGCEARRDVHFLVFSMPRCWRADFCKIWQAAARSNAGTDCGEVLAIEPL
jgi:hypothetical protein